MARQYERKAKAATDPTAPAAENIPANAPGYVVVFANLAHPFEFHLEQGRKLIVNGYPVSKLVAPGGEALPGGQYGETRGVKSDDWEYILAHYGEMQMFKAGLVFAEDDYAYGQARAEDQQELRHGLEQADPNAGGTRPLAKSE